MKSRRTILLLTAALAFPLSVATDGRVKNSDQDKNKAPMDAIVNFGDPVILAGADNHVLVPDDTTIRKGGTITFIVNGPGHGIAIYPVSGNTTRDDITAQLCSHDPACDPAFANEDHTTRDGKDNVVIVTGTNPPFARVDDPTDRLFATSTQIGGVPGVFLTGTTPTTPGTQLQFRFDKSGRYLAVCMNRNHYLANWMFGFINVVAGNDK
jgi:plastocyanin